MVEKKNVVSIEDRIPKLKEQRRKKANRRLIFLLLLFFILIACILYFQSPLSHVQAIKVGGNDVYSEQDIIDQADLTHDTNIWKVENEEVEEKIGQLPEIRKVEVKKKFPSTILVQIEELKRIAYVSVENYFLPVLENGKILSENQSTTIPLNAPILFSFTEDKALKEMIIAIEQLPEEVLNSISEVHYDPTDSDEFHISLYMNDGNEVSATIRTFAEKMVHYPAIVSQLEPNQKGVINLEVGSYFKAFEPEGDEPNEERGQASEENDVQEEISD
ncbi:FtsQ-type POTRA domain-containing protein [Niallia sp. XMNu-256]|uniref:cell division protein FtsQ/DivIB n=1 Tax=Niallia sp. XMNu-256 TaxID=3082444 RepID=UPI0030D14E9A